MSILGERFFKLSNALFCYHLTPIQFTVYSFLVCSAGLKQTCWPSMKTIAANCGCSVNAAREAVRVLEQRGFIQKVSRYRDRPNGGMRQTSNSYFILDPPPLPISLGHPTPGDGGELHEQDEGEQIKPSTVVGAKSASRGTPFGHSPLRSLAPPLPIEPASLGFDGAPEATQNREATCFAL